MKRSDHQFRDRFSRRRMGGVPPDAVSGLTLWVDMLDPAAFSESGGTMVSVTNKVSSTVWSDPAVTNKPAYSDTALNGHPGMVFTSANSEALMSTEAAVAAALAAAAEYTVFLVARNTIAAASVVILGTGDGTAAGSRLIGTASSGGGRYRNSFVNDDGTFTVNQTAGGTNDTAVHVHAWRRTAGSIIFELDGRSRLEVTPATQIPTTMTTTRVALGCRPDPAPDAFHDGAAGLWLVYNRALSDAELKGVAKFQLPRWSIA